MNGDVTVREVMQREFVGVSEADTLRDTAGLMLEEGVEAVAVLRGSDPEGLLTQQDILEVAVEGAALSDTVAADAMRTEVPIVEPDTPLTAAADRMSGQQARHLLVMGDRELLGLVSEHDVVTATTLDPGGESETREVATEAARAEAAVVGESEATATEEYSTQGICEVCGTLTRNLSSFNGQLVCSDCRDV